MKGGFGNIMKQAQQMQADMEKLQQELLGAEVVGESGAGMVKVTMNGRHDVKRVEIDPELMGDDQEMLEDLLAAAVNDANRRIEKMSQEKMSSLTAGMGLPPGIKLPFSDMTEPSLLERLIEALRCMPGIGPKSAQRIAHQLLQRNRDGAKHLAAVLQDAMDNIGHCEQCRTFTEHRLCHYCDNPKRDNTTICVVENPSDVSALEEAHYRGRYFVLLGHLSPLDGIGPDELGLDKFKEQLRDDALQEVILATSATVEGEATAHFISEMVKTYGKKVSRIAHGIPMGGELEYVNSMTIAHALKGRKVV